MEVTACVLYKILIVLTLLDFALHVVSGVNSVLVIDCIYWYVT